MLLIESAGSTLSLISEPAKVTQPCLDGKSRRASTMEVKEPGIPSVISLDRQQDRGKQPRCAAWHSLPRFLLCKKCCYLVISKALERGKVYKWGTAMASGLGPTLVCKKTSDLLVHVFPQVISLKTNVLSESFSILMSKRNSHLWKEGKFRASKSTFTLKPDNPSSIPDPMIGENQLSEIVLWLPHSHGGTHTLCPAHHIHTEMIKCVCGKFCSST